MHSNQNKETVSREQYVTPETETVQIKVETSILTNSPGAQIDPGNPFGD